MKGMFALWNATTYRLHKHFGEEIGSKMHPLNKRCMVLSPVAEATRTPDEIMLAIMQSFSSQLSGFLSLLLLKRCFEIWLPFEVSRVQHDIYLRYNPHCLLSRSRPLFLSEPLFPFSQRASSIFFSRTRALEMASKRCHRPAALLSPPPLRGAGGGHRAPWRPRPGGAPFEGEARGRRSPCCGGGRLLTNPGPAVTQASPPVNLPAALTGAWRLFKPLRASRRAALPYEVFHNNNSC